MMDLLTMMMEEPLNSRSDDLCLESERESHPTNMEDLPQDAMNSILSFLTYTDYQELCIVSKRLNEVVSHASHLFMMDSYSPNYTRLSLLADIGKRPMEMHLDEARLRGLLNRYPSLNVLHLHGLAGVGDKLFAVLNESPASSTITQLSLHGCSLSYWCPNSLALTNLRHIRISGGSIRAAFGSLLSACTSLQSLSIGQCSSLRDENIADLVQNLRHKLEHLSLHQCLRVKNPVLQFDTLLSLNLMGCFALTNLLRFRCPTLQRLDLSFCFRLEGARIQKLIQTLPTLQELVLVKCPGVEELIIEDAPELKSVNVSLCTNLRHLELHCPKLIYVENESCCKLATVIMKVGTLPFLNLSMLPVQNLELEAPLLTTLDLSGCRFLERGCCTLTCPMLQKVNVCGSGLWVDQFEHVRLVRQGVVRQLTTNKRCVWE